MSLKRPYTHTYTLLQTHAHTLLDVLAGEIAWCWQCKPHCQASNQLATQMPRLLLVTCPLLPLCWWELSFLSLPHSLSLSFLCLSLFFSILPSLSLCLTFSLSLYVTLRFMSLCFLLPCPAQPSPAQRQTAPWETERGRERQSKTEKGAGRVQDIERGCGGYEASDVATEAGQHGVLHPFIFSWPLRNSTLCVRVSQTVSWHLSEVRLRVGKRIFIHQHSCKAEAVGLTFTPE